MNPAAGRTDAAQELGQHPVLSILRETPILVAGQRLLWRGCRYASLVVASNQLAQGKIDDVIAWHGPTD